MSQGKTFEDFLNWKKGQHKGGSNRRYKDESSSDSDSSHEEVKFSKKKSSSNRYRVDDSHSDSSEEKSVSRRKKSSSRGISRRNTMNDRYTSEREDNRRGYNDRDDNRRYTSEREDNRKSYDDRRYTSEREDNRRGYNDREERYSEREDSRSRNSKGVDRSSKRESRRYRDESSSDEEIIVRSKPKSKSSGSINKRLSRRQEYDDSNSSDDDHSSRYRRNVDSSDSEEVRKKKTRSANNTIKRSTNRRAKSEHNLNPKRTVTKKKPVQDDYSSDDEYPQQQRRHTVKSSSTRNVSSPPKKKASKRPPQQDEESSEEIRPTTPKNGNKKSTSSKSISNNDTKIENNKSSSNGKPHLVIHQKNFDDENREEGNNHQTKNSHHSDSHSTKKSHTNSTSIKNHKDIRFNHIAWLEKYDQIYNSKDKEAKKKRSMLKDLLDKIEDQTDSVCEGAGFLISDKDSDKIYVLNTHDISSGVKRTQAYNYHHLEKFLPADGVKGTTKTTAHFIKSDILDVGLFIKREIKKNPLVLVSGDPRTPGGKDHRCLFGEEISIWRRTAIREYLEEDKRKKFFGEGDTDEFVYDIAQNGAVYCPDVPVFRSNPKKGYSFIEPETLSFVIIPPILNPVLVNGRLKSEDEEILRKKLTLIFLTALANNHDAVVVTAFGCGYAQNPPQHVAEIFTEVINKFRNFFANIAFAIIDNANARKNSPEGNIVPFSNVFNTLQKKVPSSTTN